MLGIYIHYPFCKSKCPYCDFNSHVQNEINHQNFIEAYKKEIDFFANKTKGRKVKTIFFGGGTPSLMPIKFLLEIIDKIYSSWNVEKDCEITLEANPTSFESDKFKEFQKCGINRLSLGIQALNDNDLKFLGRNHSFKESIDVIESAANIFDNFSFDLIYARPNQNIKDWIKELEYAISFNSKHLSLYQLTIEKGTKFYKQFLNQEFSMPDEDLSAEFYDVTNEIMREKNFNRYEISNFCKSDFECRHNLVYWNGDDYIGIGAGSHSRVYFDNEKDRSAITMIYDPNLWLNRVLETGNGILSIENIDKDKLLDELILMGMRLEDGINISALENKMNLKFCHIFNQTKINYLFNKKIIEVSNNRFKICKEFKMITNLVIKKILECKQ